MVSFREASVSLSAAEPWAALLGTWSEDWPEKTLEPGDGLDSQGGVKLTTFGILALLEAISRVFGE